MTQSRILATAAAGILALAALCLASLLLGARSGIGIVDLASLVTPPAAEDAAGIVVREMRLPRTLGALIAGSALGIAGALLQTLTRNPLADPGLLGVNSGAALAIVTTVWLVGPVPPAALIVPTLLGAFLALAVVWSVGASSRSPLTLILAGAALTAFLAAVLRGLILLDPFALDTFRSWSVGVLDRTGFEALGVALPVAAIGITLAVPAALKLDTLALGDDLASALGVNLAAARGLTLAAVGVLSTAAVLVAGPLTFVGLVAPHLARALAAQSALGLMALSGSFGAALVLVADIAGRIIVPGVALEAGLGVALIGGGFLIWLVRREARNPA